MHTNRVKPSYPIEHLLATSGNKSFKIKTPKSLFKKLKRKNKHQKIQVYNKKNQ